LHDTTNILRTKEQKRSEEHELPDTTNILRTKEHK
jgi:hypothetical protein